ncbi:MAG: hypothetical protein JW925_04605 [Syntrophaceae bacterium]|nr:hypothetical protein [Syntrophaceae bacterium]
MGKTKLSQMSTKSDWKLFGGRIPPELAKAVRILSIKNDISVQDLMIEAFNDVLIKHREKPPKLAMMR